MRLALGCPYFQRAFGFSVPIGALGGLIGLGGGRVPPPRTNAQHRLRRTR